LAVPFHLLGRLRTRRGKIRLVTEVLHETFDAAKVTTLVTYGFWLVVTEIAFDVANGFWTAPAQSAVVCEVTSGNVCLPDGCAGSAPQDHQDGFVGDHLVSYHYQEKSAYLGRMHDPHA
jgi:hypothetical protein